MWSSLLQQYLPFTVLKLVVWHYTSVLYLTLQQYLPFTVLKLKMLVDLGINNIAKLQQYLPFTVLKLY